MDLDTLREILDSIKRHKLRTALTAFGVFWGIFMLVNLLGVGKGLHNGALAQIGTLDNAIFIWNGRPTSIPYKGLSVGRSATLRSADLTAIRNELSMVDLISPRNGRGEQYVVHQGSSEAFDIAGVSPYEFSAKGFNAQYGRYLNAADLDAQRKVAVIGDRVHQVLFGPDKDPVGKQIQIQGVSFIVVGVVSPSALNNWAQRDRERVYIPHTTMRSTFNQKDVIHSFFITPKPGWDALEVGKRVIALLQQRHRVHPQDTGAFGFYNGQKAAQRIEGLFTGITVFSWVVAIGTIFAGAVGVGNIMLITVKERTREIGIRKALGATPLSIISAILKESLVITFLAGYLGLVFGVLSLELIAKHAVNNKSGMGAFLDPQVSFGTALVAIGVLLLAGAIAALLPALKAASVDPVVALQDE